MSSSFVFRGAKVYDGTGAPWFRADVSVKGDVITSLGPEGEGQGQVIDLDGLVLSPGFIDAHSHSDLPLMVDGRACSKIMQGVTTEVIGQCGSSGAPLNDETREMVFMWLQNTDIEPDWNTVSEYMDRLESQGIAVNVCALVGHRNLRQIAMGGEDRAPSDAEMEAMKRLLHEAMEDGCFGMSTGLIYPPGAFAKPPELEELAGELARYRGIYFTHMRDEGDGLLESIQESVDLGRAAGVPVHISHLKSVGRSNWGKAVDALSALDRARAEGVDLTCDQYPYTASATGLTALLPHWAHDGGRQALLARLHDEDASRQLVQYLVENPKERKWEEVLISRVASQERAHLEGKNLVEVARALDLSPPEAVLEILRLEDLAVGMVAFGMSEDDVQLIMAHPLTMTGSDGSALAKDGPLSGGKPHPRNFGTFPRVLGHYSRDQGVFPLEEALRRMTCLPASRMGLCDRGLIRAGLKADLIAFDATKVIDRGTFSDPSQYPDGIEYVMVNGQLAVAGGKQTDARAGRVIRRG